MGIFGSSANSLLGGTLGNSQQSSLPTATQQQMAGYYNQTRRYTSDAETPVDTAPMLLNVNIQIEEIENGYLFTLWRKKMHLTELDGIGDIILSRIAADRILNK